MAQENPSNVQQATLPQRMQRWPGACALLGWFFLLATVSALSVASNRISTTELLILRLIFLCPGALSLLFAAAFARGMTRFMASLGLGAAVLLLWIVFRSADLS